jgi:PAS domain S-box-containing protein
MDLPNEIRIKIADKLVRIAAPAIIFVSVLITLGILIIWDSQYKRLIPLMILVPSMVIAWFITVKGRPMLGFSLLLTFLSFTILAGMSMSGGIRAPAYMIVFSLVTIITFMFDLKGGLIFAVSSILVGCLFVWLKSMEVLPEVDKSSDPFLLMFFATFIAVQLFFVLVPARLTFSALIESKNRGEELKKAINNRIKAQEELQSILNNTPDIIYRLDTDGKFTFLNDEIRNYGVDPERLIGENFLTFVHMDDKQKAEKALIVKESCDTETDIEVRLLLQKIQTKMSGEKYRKESWSTFLVSSFLVFSEDGSENKRSIGSQGIARDISKQKHDKSQMIRLATVVEQAYEDVIITNSLGIIEYVNSAFERLSGYTKDEVIGENPRFLKSGKHDKAFYTNLWNTIKGGKIWKGKIWNKTKTGGLILLDVSIMPIFDKDEITGYASVRRDITEKDQLEERLRQAQKMEAIGLLAGGIAHDFNNILSAIIGFSELILEELNKENPHVEYVDQILTAGHRAKDLVGQILMFSRQTEHKMVPVKISSLAKEVIRLLKATLPIGIEIETEFYEDLIPVLADSAQIHQIFMNICTNASHAIGEKGILTIKANPFTFGDNSKDSVPNLAPGNYVNVQISDTGHGIPQDLIKKIFDPFFTTKSRDEGTGMGLSVVHGIIKNHGGEITVNSEPGVGTTFNIYLPVMEDQNKKSNGSKSKIPKGDEHILFVDDEASLVEIGKKILGMLGYKVTGITDSVAAWEMFQKDPEQFDLVITDKSMPEMTGLELSQNIQSTNTDIPIILCTGFSEGLTIDQAKEIGIDAILHKPMIIKDIADAIRSVIDS